VEQGDMQGLLAAIDAIKKRGKDEYTENCREYAVRKFKKEISYSEYIRLYEDLITSSKTITK
jgi:hypothetical protein